MELVLLLDVEVLDDATVDDAAAGWCWSTGARRSRRRQRVEELDELEVLLDDDVLDVSWWTSCEVGRA